MKRTSETVYLCSWVITAAGSALRGLLASSPVCLVGVDLARILAVLFADG